MSRRKRRKQPDWIPMYTILGDFRGWAWRRDSEHTSYLLYVEPWGEC
jgi:hypothetical protein